MRRIAFFSLALAVTASVFPAAAVTHETMPAPRVPVYPVMSDGVIDARASRFVPPLASAAAAAGRLQRAVPGLEITWNARFGTAKHVLAGTHFLSPPARGEATDIARAWLAANRYLFGLSAPAVRGLAVTRDGALPEGGVSALVFRQMYGSIPTFAGGTIGVNVAADGRIASVWADTSRTGTLNPAPKLSAADAVRAVASREGIKMDVSVHAASTHRADRLTIFEAGGLFNRHNARLVAFPTASGPVLGWRVFLSKASDEMLSTVVDAGSGAVLFRNNQVDDFEGKVFQNYPGAPKGGAQEVVSFDGDPNASPRGWVGLPINNTSSPVFPTTIGNNVLASTDWGEFKLAPAGLALALVQLNPVPDYAPVSPTGQFNYDFQNNWAKACTPAATLPSAPVVGAKVIENPSYVGDRDPSVTNIFYLINKIHDLAYHYGYTEKYGNMQFNNFGKGGKGGDEAHYQAMAGILNNSVDNANMFTPADGGEPTEIVDVDVARPTDSATGTAANLTGYIPPFGNMYLWRPVTGFDAPCVDGDQDASVAWHEYTHGISNRLVGGPDDADALSAAQSGSMGEAWSDWVAMNFLHGLRLEDKAIEGIYATGNSDTGIRHFRLDDNPLTYGDFGFGARGPEVHDDGEIWSGTLWSLRTALIKKYGVREGTDRVTHLVFDAMAVSPRLPTMLDERDAILVADLTRYQADDFDLIWDVFAERGMGRSAKAVDATDVHPRPGFDVSGATPALVQGTIFDGDGGVLRGRLYLGIAQGQPTYVTTAGTNGRYALRLAPGTYNLTVGAPGYGMQPQGTLRVLAGAQSRDIVLAKNVASVGYGAKPSGIAPDTGNGTALLDDHDSSGQVVDVGTPVVVDLAGGMTDVRAVSVTPTSRGANGAATKFTVELSADGKKWTAVKSGGVKAIKPRPRVTEFGRVYTALKAPMKAKFARVTVTDTLFGKPSSGKWRAILRDFSVYGTGSGAKVGPGGGVEAPFTESGTITLANAGGGSGGADASITEQAWLSTCTKPTAPVQGLDAYIVQLPDSSGDGLHQFNEINKGGTSTDLDLYFWNADCSAELGRAATGAASEGGPLPPGTKWVLVVLFAGTTDGFDTISKTTLEAVDPPRGTAKPPRRK